MYKTIFNKHVLTVFKVFLEVLYRRDRPEFNFIVDSLYRFEACVAWMEEKVGAPKSGRKFVVDECYFHDKHKRQLTEDELAMCIYECLSQASNALHERLGTVECLRLQGYNDTVHNIATKQIPEHLNASAQYANVCYSKIKESVRTSTHAHMYTPITARTPTSTPTRTRTRTPSKATRR